MQDTIGYDVESGLFWCNSRYYNPEWGRWISPDSIEYLDPSSINGLNLYAYCGNDPVNYYDPFGCFAIEIAAGWALAEVVKAILIALGVAVATGTVLAIGDEIISNTNPTNNMYINHYSGEVHNDVDYILLNNGSDVELSAVALNQENYLFYAEHKTTKNGKGHLKNKHQNGFSRKLKDAFGEKGDIRRRRYRKLKILLFLLLRKKGEENENY